MFENGKIAVFEGECRRFRIIPKVLRLTVPRIIDQCGRKRCQKKRKDESYQLLKEFFFKCFVVYEWSAVKYSFSTVTKHTIVCRAASNQTLNIENERYSGNKGVSTKEMVGLLGQKADNQEIFRVLPQAIWRSKWVV